MNVLLVPMFALSRMGGPWSRAQAIAAAFERAGHHVVLGISDDGNCVAPCVSDTCKLPVPSPLGLPMALSSRTFPIAEKLGIAGRKPVHSFEEVLWLTGALSRDYEAASISALCDIIEDKRIDVVYSEYNIPAIIAAHALGLPVFGSFSYTTQTSYANDPRRAGGVRKLLRELDLPEVESSLDIFNWLSRRFVPSCPELEPINDKRVEYVGFLRDTPDYANDKRDCILVYLGAGSVPQRQVERVVGKAISDIGVDVYVAGCKEERQEGNMRFATRLDFSQLLPRAHCFIHHGGQNSTMDALAYGVPQVIIPGRVFERKYNAGSITRAGAGVCLDSFAADGLRDSCLRVMTDASYSEAADRLRQSLSAGGGAQRTVSEIELLTG